ncbi:MAG: molybdopterin-dependent oxidoreductase, partial [Proteobacteria bacterium]|nr:molybdopterin-dependent oxidoreductase [Pseudomonadota bacterium]
MKDKPNSLSTLGPPGSVGQPRNINRRQFLKALGLSGGTAALSACRTGVDDNRYHTPIEEALPYVVRPHQVTPGTPTFFATTIGRGPHAFPLTARHRDGRIVNVGANKMAPVDPAVPASALFALQNHYSPDRLREPRQGGTAGTPLTDETNEEGQLVRTSWQIATQMLVDAVLSARAANKAIVWLGPYRSGTLADLIQSCCDKALFWEPLGYANDAAAAQIVFGKRFLPTYHLEHARTIIGFGADFLGDSASLSHQSAFSKAKNPDFDGFITRFAHISPYRGQTGANADDWYACRPGTESMVAMAIARLVAEQRPQANEAARELALQGNPDDAANASGISIEIIQDIADRMLNSGPSVALPGGTSGASDMGT